MGYSGLWNGTDQVPLRAVESGQIGRFGNVDPTTGGKNTPLQPLGGIPAEPRQRRAAGPSRTA